MTVGGLTLRGPQVELEDVGVDEYHIERAEIDTSQILSPINKNIKIASGIPKGCPIHCKPTLVYEEPIEFSRDPVIEMLNNSASEVERIVSLFE